ncbi:hypothetical protein H2248_001497 [Termitomyces sp. 'cryptogamus']|nr:hypothetical protein H2248_001497 [Termitomyces sp. 'cryptogamus']
MSRDPVLSQLSYRRNFLLDLQLALMLVAVVILNVLFNSRIIRYIVPHCFILQMNNFYLPSGLSRNSGDAVYTLPFPPPDVYLMGFMG